MDSRISSSKMYSEQGLDGQNVLLVGPGWLGSAAALALAAAGARVWTVQRSPGIATSGFQSAAADTSAITPDAPPGVAHPGHPVTRLTGDIRTPVWWTAALPPVVHHIVVCVAPSRSAGDQHASTYPAALRGALLLAEQCGARSLVYTSSTGVYGRADGRASHEDDAIEIVDARQAALLHAEQLLQTATAPAVSRTILRVAGLYGPSRDPAPRFKRQIPFGADDVWCNFAWRDDVVAAIVRCVERPAADGATRIFNCADGTPVRASRIAAALGAPPASTHDDHASAQATLPTRPVGRSNQRISSAPLRETGWQPRMATVFDGLVALGYPLDPIAEAARAHRDLESQ